MATNFEDIFSDEQSVAEPVEAVEQEPVQEAAPVEVPRDEHGRFAPKGEEKSASPAPVEEPQLEHPALIGERRRRQEAEARIVEYEAKLAAMQRPEPAPMPDPIVDPEGYGTYFKQELETARYQDRLYYSQQMASFKHGEEAVQDGIKWGMARCDADPYFNNKVRSSIDPVGVVVDEFKRDQIASQVTDDDWQQFQQWKAAKDSPPPAAQPPALPDSLATAGAGRMPAASAHKPKLLSLQDILGGR
jgi:hypothetical protein